MDQCTIHRGSWWVQHLSNERSEEVMDVAVISLPSATKADSISSR